MIKQMFKSSNSMYTRDVVRKVYQGVGVHNTPNPDDIPSHIPGGCAYEEHTYEIQTHFVGMILDGPDIASDLRGK